MDPQRPQEPATGQSPLPPEVQPLGLTTPVASHRQSDHRRSGHCSSLAKPSSPGIVRHRSEQAPDPSWTTGVGGMQTKGGKSRRARPCPSWRQKRIVHRGGIALLGPRELPGPGGPKEANNPPDYPSPWPAFLGTPNLSQTKEYDSVDPLLRAHLPPGSSRAATELRAPTRPPFIHLAPPPVRGGAASQSRRLLGSGRRALRPAG